MVSFAHYKLQRVGPIKRRMRRPSPQQALTRLQPRLRSEPTDVEAISVTVDRRLSVSQCHQIQSLVLIWSNSSSSWIDQFGDAFAWISYLSSATSIATVSASGLVTGVALGDVVITAMVGQNALATISVKNRLVQFLVL